VFIHWVNSVWDSSVLGLVTGSVNAFSNRQRKRQKMRRWEEEIIVLNTDKKRLKKTTEQLMLKVFRKIPSTAGAGSRKTAVLSEDPAEWGWSGQE